MKLVDVTVRMFKNILDSTKVDVQPDVTCLVGKNEAGKSAFLNALYRLNPARPNVSFDVPRHYPAWLQKKHQLKQQVLEDVEPIAATFELEAADIAAANAGFGTEVVSSPTITFARSYRNTWSLNVSVNEAAFVKYLAETPGVAPEVKQEIAKISTVGAFRTFVAELEASAIEARQTSGVALAAAVTEKLGTDSLTSRVEDALEARVPKFFYYSDYSSLPARIKVRELLSADPKTLTDDLLTARSLLRMAATDDQYLLNADYELRKRELENVANALTSDVLKYWTQNPDLRVLIDVSQEIIKDGAKTTTAIEELKIRMWDERHWLSLPFDERSTGFRWFFSFLAAFSEYEFRADPVIILLDEPALGLHARAQKDFLRFIDERLSDGRQVVYSTHSPFMVQPGKLERARIVEDRGKEIGSQVTGDVLSTDPDTLFPLQGALGYDIVQHLFIGEHNLVVEGTADFTYLTVVSDFLPDTRTKLDSRWSILPVGGVDLIPTFVALLGQHLNLTVLIDSRREGAQRLTKMAADGYLKNKRIITIGEVVNQKHADIEDLFTVEDYLVLYNAAFGKTWAATDIPAGTDSLVSRIARLEGVDRFEHGKLADVFLRRRDEFLPKLSAATLDNFEALFKRVNATLGT